MKKVITTVGTSLFVNYGKANKSIFDVKDFFKEWENRTPQQLKENKYNKELALEELGRIKKNLKYENASAEIASLLAIQKEIGEPIEVHLICTDTALSVMAAECIEHWFKDKRDNFTRFEVISISSLLVTDKKTLNKGLKNLFDEIYQKVPIDKFGKRVWDDIILNITGGYKAIIPHLTILGQIYGRPIYYVFDDETKKTINYELIKIPSLPISFDWLISEIYGQFLSTDLMLNNLLNFEPTASDVLSEYGLIKEGDKENEKKIDVFGSLMWQNIQSKKPENPSVMGAFVEMKVYEYFNENRGMYSETPKRSVKYYWNGKDDNIIKSPKEDKFKDEKAEIDLILQGGNHYAAFEVKSIGQIQHFVEPNSKGRIDYLNKIKTLKLFYQSSFQTFGLVIFKNPYFPDSDLNENEYLKIIQKTCIEEGIGFKVYVTDFAINRKKQTLEFTEFLNNPLILKEII